MLKDVEMQEMGFSRQWMEERGGGRMERARVKVGCRSIEEEEEEEREEEEEEKSGENRKIKGRKGSRRRGKKCG